MIVATLLLSAAVAGEAPVHPFKRDVVLAFAECVYRKSPQKVRLLLATPPGSDREFALTGELVGRNEGCIGERAVLSFQTGLLRGQLAETVFAADPAMRDATARIVPQAVVLPDEAALSARAAKVDVKYRDQRFLEMFREAYARCLVQANPSGVARILPVPSGSPAERAALLAVGQTLSSCMPPTIRYSVKPAELRPYLLSALYFAAASAPAGI